MHLTMLVTPPAPLVDWLLAGLRGVTLLPLADLHCLFFESGPHALVEEPKVASIAPQPVCLLIPHSLSLEQRFLNVLKNFLLFLPRC